MTITGGETISILPCLSVKHGRGFTQQRYHPSKSGTDAILRHCQVEGAYFRFNNGQDRIVDPAGRRVRPQSSIGQVYVSKMRAS